MIVLWAVSVAAPPPSNDIEASSGTAPEPLQLDTAHWHGQATTPSSPGASHQVPPDLHPNSAIVSQNSHPDPVHVPPRTETPQNGPRPAEPDPLWIAIRQGRRFALRDPQSEPTVSDGTRQLGPIRTRQRRHRQDGNHGNNAPQSTPQSTRTHRRILGRINM
jgi:hypothetical protein